MQSKERKAEVLSIAPERVFPALCAIEDEEEVLGAILLDPNAIIRVADTLKPEHFYSQAHGIIYQASLALHLDQLPTDMLAVAAWLRDRGLLNGVGGQSKIVALVESTIGSATIEYAAERIIGKFKRRSLKQIASEISALCDSAETEEEAISFAESKIFNLTEAASQKGLRHLDYFLQLELDRIERVQSGEETVGIPTKFYDLDAITQGMKPETLWILAGRPGMGKSALAANIARNVAAQGHQVALFSLEMSGGQIARRLLSAEARIDSTMLGSGRFPPAFWEPLGHAYAFLASQGIQIDDSQSVSISTIRSQCRRLKAQQGLGLVVIDYLHLMLDGDDDDQVREIGKITRQCKKLSRELKCPILLLSQLSRAVEQRSNKRPQMSDLRSSGSIEQDADLVAFVYRDEYYDEGTVDRGIAEVIISKQRDGATGTVKLLFEPQFSQFRNLAQSGGGY